MKRSVLVLALVAGCGVSDPSSWEKCATCAADPNGLWDIIADGAEVSGGGDFLGPIDPYLCLTVGGTTKCTYHSSDNRDPRFDETLFTRRRVSEIVGRPLTFAVWDKDTDTALDPNDQVCSGSTTFTTHDLAEGGQIVNCSGAMAAFRLEYAGSTQ